MAIRAMGLTTAEPTLGGINGKALSNTQRACLAGACVLGVLAAIGAAKGIAIGAAVALGAYALITITRFVANKLMLPTNVSPGLQRSSSSGSLTDLAKQSNTLLATERTAAIKKYFNSSKHTSGTDTRGGTIRELGGSPTEFVSRARSADIKDADIREILNRFSGNGNWKGSDLTTALSSLD